MRSSGLSIAQLESKIEALNFSYQTERKQGNADKARSLYTELLELAFERFAKDINEAVLNGDSYKQINENLYDIAIDKILSCIDNFDVSKGGKLCNLISRSIALGSKDSRKDKGQEHYHTVDDEYGKKTRVKHEYISLDAQSSVNEDDDTKWYEKIEDHKADRDLENTDESLLVDLINVVKKFEDAKSLPKKVWYSLFYTEHITTYAKDNPSTPACEHAIFDAMDTNYLDYYMKEICRNIVSLAETPLKIYGDLVSGRSMHDETPVPLPEDVSLTYVENTYKDKMAASKSGRSNYLKEYREIMQSVVLSNI